MRIRILHPGWLVLSVVLLTLTGTVFHFWWKHRQTEALIAEVRGLGGTVNVEYSTPRWFVTWAKKRGLEPHLRWLKTDISSLDVKGETIDDAWLHRLRSMKGLRHLRLGKTRITDAGLKELHALSKLRTLSLYNNDITDAGVESLRSLTSLESLYLSRTKVTGENFSTLKSLTGLRRLVLSQTPVTDAGMSQIVTLTGLIHLEINKTRITDEGLAMVTSLPRLQILDVNDTFITKAGVQRLLKMPHLEILLATRSYRGSIYLEELATGRIGSGPRRASSAQRLRDPATADAE